MKKTGYNKVDRWRTTVECITTTTTSRTNSVAAEAIEWNSMHNACVHSSQTTISSLKGDSTVTNNNTVQALPFWEDQTDKSEKGTEEEEGARVGKFKFT